MTTTINGITIENPTLEQVILIMRETQRQNIKGWHNLPPQPKREEKPKT